MVPAKDVVADSVTRAEKCDIAIVNTDDGTALNLVRPRPAVLGFHFRGNSQDPAKLRYVRLEQSGQNYAARVLPFLEWRWGL